MDTESKYCKGSDLNFEEFTSKKRNLNVKISFESSFDLLFGVCSSHVPVLSHEAGTC